jgi:sulfate transport system substrate-binding protein
MTGLVAMLLPLGLLVVAPSTTSGAASATTVNVVGYSVVSTAFSALEKAFEATPAGQGVTFTNSFGASTTQAESVVAGQPADVTLFSQQPDLDLLVSAGLVSGSWASYSAGAAEQNIMTDSVVALVVRRGNPLGITGWDSLTKKGVQIVTPDPISSGSARWNLLAAYESQLQQKQSAAKANTYLNKLIGNVVAEPPSGSKALATFTSGAGNVLLAYEADGDTAISTGQQVQVVEPKQNVLIQNPSALTTSGLAKPAAVAFYAYLFSVDGQTIWIHQHFRSTLPQFQKLQAQVFYTPPKLVTIKALGGWTNVTNKFFSPTGIVTKDEAAHGFTS